MTHDIDDLLELILQLEKRILKLESTAHYAADLIHDNWYWDH